ncbi:MAG: hypothetical protein ACETWG_04710, partial [Candidatus Neomarinimicrobiota bacterium]
MKAPRLPLYEFILVSLILLPAPRGLWGQISPSPGIILPYEGAEVTGLRLEDIVFPSTDRIPDILEDPAALSFLNSLRFYASFTSDFSATRLEPVDGLDTTIDQRSQRLIPGHCSLALPFRLMNRPWAIGAAFNGRYDPIYTTDDLTIENPLGEFSWQQSGNISSASVGMSTRLLPRTSMGISWTQWFGERQEITTSVDLSSDFESTTTGSYSYSGHFLGLGFTTTLPRLTMGLVAYTPFELMEGDKMTTVNGLDRFESIHQKYYGALKARVVYVHKPNLTFGLAYRYQERITTEHQSDEFSYNSKYGPSTKLAIGVGYTPRLKRIRLPLYAAYIGH